MHGHSLSMIMLVLESIRASVDSKQGDSEQTYLNKMVNNLNNAMMIAQQIQNFDSLSINDCFDNNENTIQ